MTNEPPINKAALDQASAARKHYRANTPVSLYSVEGEDAVFIAAYLEAVARSKADEFQDTADAQRLYEEWLTDGGRASVLALAHKCFEAGRSNKSEGENDRH